MERATTSVGYQVIQRIYGWNECDVWRLLPFGSALVRHIGIYLGDGLCESSLLSPQRKASKKRIHFLTKGAGRTSIEEAVYETR